MRGLKNKIAIVTGGLGDLGFASAQRLAEEGVRVAIFDRKAEHAPVAALAGATAFAVDMTKPQEIADAVAAVAQTIGTPTILVNCAAIFVFRGVEATTEEWEAILKVNVIGASLIAGQVVPLMKAAGGGSIINFSSVSGFVGQSRFATYNATKFAIRGLTKCWAQIFAPLNIRVNTVCPGYIYTKSFENSCRMLNLDLEQENARASAMHLLNRQGRPAEVAAAVAFLASDDSSFMTGSDLVVDGGYLAK